MQHKVLFVYQDEPGGPYKIESVWATQNGEHYRIDNIPFFAKNIAYGDIVSVEEDDGELYFDGLITPSGHSVVRLVITDEQEVDKVGQELIALGCDWEGSHIKNLISVDIPKEIDYNKIKQFLDKGRQQDKWDYQEACLG